MKKIRILIPAILILIAASLSMALITEQKATYGNTTQNVTINSTTIAINGINVCLADSSTPFTGTTQVENLAVQGNVTISGTSLLNNSVNLKNKPLVQHDNVTITVCDSGCDYTIANVNQALLAKPYLLYGTYRVNLSCGDYGDLYITPSVVGRSTNSEGSVAALQIVGNVSDRNCVLVNSIQMSGLTGAIAVKINYLTVDGVDPKSDENVSISIYGSNTVEIQNVNFTADANNAIMVYGAKANINNNTFNGQNRALYVKVLGTAMFGDNYQSSGNKGSVIQDLIVADEGTYVMVRNNSVTYGNNFVSTASVGVVIDADNSTIYNIKNFGDTLNITNTAQFQDKVVFGASSVGGVVADFYTDDSTTSTGTVDVVQDGTGDATVRFLLVGLRSWHMGIDNSDNDNFKIASNSDLNTNVKFELSDDFVMFGATNYTNSGAGYACFDTNGVLYKSSSACV